ncbi:LysR family substrate-binding domain-containing protein [Nocardioides donggukensis]|uniref:LysR family substrate-binding domain-containing protein n=1 Tax=Nocardioides donggukensis TaxID=2774019 RepID=A0A927PZ34_9ACTN|nr:LysR family substrate-binding domain-containing protein [Nocardioides donggukensis]MBD8869473.1 LysR family substrate-binding domain-containing protein [Nocardioides donggukensis]
MVTSLRIGFVPGVTPDKWARTWREREQVPLELVPVPEQDQRQALDNGSVHMCFVRLPLDQERLHVIPLYVEVAVVVAHKEHPVAAYDQVPLADLAHEQLVYGDVPGWSETVVAEQLPFPEMSVAEAVEVVASGTGVAVLPMSLARLHHRRDVVHRPVPELPGTRVALAWPTATEEDELVQTFVGVVRGRTARSSRGPVSDRAPTPAPSPDRRRSGGPRRGRGRR